MATAAPVASPFDGLQGLLGNILGSQTTGTDSRTLNTQQLLSELFKTTQNQSQTTGGTNITDALTKLASSLSGTTKTNADTSALRQVYAKQAAGITPEMLSAIFTEGSKAVPQLVATTANAVGARSSDNSPLATTLRDLNTNLTNQAATINQQMLKDSGTTAGQIADLTKSTDTTQNQNQNTTQNTNQTSQQLVQTLLDQIQNKTQNTGTNQTLRDDTTSKTGINLGQTAGAAGLASLLGALNGGAGSSLLGSAGSSIMDLIKKLTSGGGDTGAGDILSGGVLGNVSDLNLNPLDGAPGFDMTGIGGYSNGYTYEPDHFSFDDPEAYAFKDGGIVEPEMLKITDGRAGQSNGTGKADPAMTALISLASLLGKGMTGGSSVKSEATGAETTATSSAPVAANPQDPFQWQDMERKVQVAGDIPDEYVAVSGNEDLLRSIGFNEPGKTDLPAGTQLGSGIVGQGDTYGTETNPKLAEYLKEKGYTIKKIFGNADQGDPYIYTQTFDKENNRVGMLQRDSQDDGGDGFGLVIGALAALATGGLASGALAGAGVTGAAAAAGTGAAAATAGTYAQSMDLNASLKAGLVGGVTGGLAGGVNVAGQFGITNPVASGVVNGAVRGGVGSALNGGNPLQGAVKGGVSGGIKKAAFASGGLIPHNPTDPAGTADNIPIQVSGGEAVIPKDVVDHLGPEFFEKLIDMFHTPSNHATV